MTLNHPTFPNTPETITLQNCISIAVPFISKKQHQAIMADFQTILDNPPVALTNAAATPGTHATVHNMGFAFNGPKPFDSAPCRYHPGTGIKMPNGTHQPYE